VTLHQLKIFEAVARLLNVTAAAKGLGISQPAVSLQLRLLEEEYRCQFFTRSNHGVRRTERGQAFLAAIQPILEQLTAIKAEFSPGACESAANSLVVGANNTLTDTLLPDILTDFKETHPDLDIVVRTADSRTLEAGVLDMGIDVALITRSSFFPECAYEVLGDYEPVAFVPYDSDIRDTTMTIEELARYPLIARRGTSCLKEIMARGYKLKFALECDAPETVISVVRRGWGVGLLFSARLAREISRGSVRIIQLPELSDIKRHSFVAYDRRRTLSQSVQDFIHVLRRGNGARTTASPSPSKHLRSIKFTNPRTLGSAGEGPRSATSDKNSRPDIEAVSPNRHR
jgi:DNA-binding transcriptional LysR family regulator